MMIAMRTTKSKSIIMMVATRISKGGEKKEQGELG
jgi:hypothetical protein